jgi:hypothetical protein
VHKITKNGEIMATKKKPAKKPAKRAATKNPPKGFVSDAGKNFAGYAASKITKAKGKDTDSNVGDIRRSTKQRLLNTGKMDDLAKKEKKSLEKRVIGEKIHSQDSVVAHRTLRSREIEAAKKKKVAKKALVKKKSKPAKANPAKNKITKKRKSPAAKSSKRR